MNSKSKKFCKSDRKSKYLAINLTSTVQHIKNKFKFLKFFKNCQLPFYPEIITKMTPFSLWSWFFNSFLIILTINQYFKVTEKHRELQALKVSNLIRKADMASLENEILEKIKKCSDNVLQSRRSMTRRATATEEIRFPEIVNNYKKINNWEQHYKNRQTAYSQMCQKFGKSDPNLFSDYKNGKIDDYNKTASFVDQKHKILYCELPKCGCTNWKNAMLQMSGDLDPRDLGKKKKKKEEKIEYESKNSTAIAENLKNLRDERRKILNDRQSRKRRKASRATRWSHLLLENLDHFTVDDYQQVYTNDTYFKFIFVRHPLDRLISAFLDKVEHKFLEENIQGLSNFSILDSLENPDNARKRIAYENSLREFQEKSGTQNLPFENFNFNLTKPKLDKELIDKRLMMSKSAFEVFLSYIIYRGISRSGRDTIRHWKRYYDLCSFCNMNWNFIGKLETIEQDSSYLFQKLGFPELSYQGSKSAHFVDKIIDINKDTTSNYSASAKTYDQPVEKWVRYYQFISEEWISKIYEIYQPDFEGFGYDIPKWLFDYLY